MGKLSLKAKNPFGEDIEVFSTKNWIGLTVGAAVVAVFAGMVGFFRGKAGAVGSGIDALHARLGDL